MFWIIAIAALLWGFPLITTVVVALACLASERLRASVARYVGIGADLHSSPLARENAVPDLLAQGGNELQAGRS